MAPCRKDNRIYISMPIMKELFGDHISLPMKVLVDIPADGMKQHVWIRSQNHTKVAVYFNEPMLTKIKNCVYRCRKWTLHASSSASDEVPHVVLELGVHREGAKFIGLETKNGRYQVSSKILLI